MAVRFNLYYFSRETGEYLQEVINSAPQGVVGAASILSNALPELAHNEADVYFIEYNDRTPKLDLWIEDIQHHNAHAAIFLYLQEPSTDSLLRALRLGAQECFVSQISEVDFHKALQRLQKTKTSLHPGEKTQIISLLGCKGGVGVTFTAVNLSQSLSASRQEQVLLVDLDLRAGDICSILDLQPRYTILDLVENFDHIDPQYLQDIIASLEGGPDVLPGPQRLGDSELLQTQHIENILQYIRRQNLYRWLVLDLGDHLDEITLRAIECSDLVLLITLLTIPGLRDAKKMLENLQLLEINPDNVHLVVNSYSKETDIKLAEAKKFLGLDFFAVLRFDHNTVVQSINEGRPLVITQPRHKLSLDFVTLANKLTQNGGDNGHSPGRWGSLKKLLRLGGKS
jgi:pilus assembly protein CpaE